MKTVTVDCPQSLSWVEIDYVDDLDADDDECARAAYNDDERWDDTD